MNKIEIVTSRDPALPYMALGLCLADCCALGSLEIDLRVFYKPVC